jgi:hypothetical protein
MSNAKTDDQFQVWLIEMDNALQRFGASAPPDLACKLDLTPESLDAVEAWALSWYQSPQEIRPASETAFHDGAARYIGEVIRKHTGSKWSLDRSDPKKLNYGVPALTGGKLSIGMAPLTLVTALLDRRTGTYLSTVFRNVTA